MDRQFVAENARERERLRNLVSTMTDEELALPLYPEGWTVAVALAHLGFWDGWRLMLVRRWRKEGVTPPPLDEDVINDALIPFLLAIPTRKAANLSIAAAEALDRELEEIPADLTATVEALGERHALNRSIHRKMHLDEIESLLKTKRHPRK